jgi:hypothetical protein
MEIELRACCQILGKVEIRNIFDKLWQMLNHTATFIASCRETEARRRIQLYYDHRLMDELEKAGKRIAKNKSMIDVFKKTKNKRKSSKWVMFS